MHKVRLRAIFVVLALALGATFSSSVAGHDPIYDGENCHIQSPEEALREDAKDYADYWGVSVDEAFRIFELQDRIGEMHAEIREKERETFAGFWVEHGPRYRAIVLFTRDGEETIRPYAEPRGLLDVIEVRTAPRTWGELQAAQMEYTSLARNVLGEGVSSDINAKENSVEIYVLDKARLLGELERANVQLPDFVHVTEIELSYSLD